MVVTGCAAGAAAAGSDLWEMSLRVNTATSADTAIPVVPSSDSASPYSHVLSLDDSRRAFTLGLPPHASDLAVLHPSYGFAIMNAGFRGYASVNVASCALWEEFLIVPARLSSKAIIPLGL